MVLWFFAADQLLALAVPDLPGHAWIGPVKDMGYALATSLMLYLLLRARGTAHTKTRQEQPADGLELAAQGSERDRLLKHFFELPFIGMAILAPDRRWLRVNDRLCEILDLPRAALLATTWDALTHPDDLAAELARLDRLTRGSADGYTLEKRFVPRGRAADSADGAPVEAMVKVQAVREEAGQLTYLVATVQEIGVRKGYERALLERVRLQDQLTKVAASVPGVICSYRQAVDGRVTMPYASPAAEAVFGELPVALAADASVILARTHREDQPAVEASIAESARTMRPWRAEFRYLHPRRGEIWLEGHSVPLREADGAVLWHGYVQDVTARKQAATDLEESRADLIRAQALGRIGSWRLDVRKNALTWSEETHRIFGLPRGTPMTYETFLGCVHPEDRDYVNRMWQAGLAGAPYDIEHRLLVNGRVTWVRERAELEHDVQGSLLGGFGTTQDITDIKAAEQALRESEERFQLAAEIGRLGTWDWCLDTGRVVWSRGHYEILGYREGEVTPSWATCLDRLHPEDRPGVEAEVRRAMDTGEDYAGDFRVLGPDGAIRWMSARARFEHGGGSCRRMLGIMADVTERKQAEQALRDADRRKDELIAMLSHELRNPLAPIRNAAAALGRIQDPPPLVAWAQEVIQRQVGHLAHLVDDLLDVSRIARGKIALQQVPVDLGQVVGQVVDSLRPFIEGKGHHLDVLPLPPGLCLLGDPVRLAQVLVNLLDNAAKYTPDGGHITLATEVVEGAVLVRVSDNGVGMSPELVSGVFELFQQGERSLDRAQGGLGIGLTLVRGLVTLHGGEVWAKSSGPGMGSTFTVRLPLPREPLPARVPEAIPDARPPGRSLRVLVVDDDPDVADSTAVLLHLEGHEVRTAESGEEAMRILAELAPDCVLLDIGLPGESGYQVARRIRAHPLGKRVRLVAVNGYGHAEALASSRAAGFDQHLIKPVGLEALRQILAEVV